MSLFRNSSKRSAERARADGLFLLVVGSIDTLIAVRDSPSFRLAFFRGCDWLSRGEKKTMSVYSILWASQRQEELLWKTT